MRNFLLSLCCILMSTALFAQQELVGDWEGDLKVGNIVLPLLLHISLSGDSLAVTLDSPQQGARGLSAKRVGYDAPNFSAVWPNMMIDYRGIYKKSGPVIEGTFQQGNQTLPLEFKPLGNADYNNSRPQDPNPPFPYSSDSIYFNNEAANITLGGTLTIPTGKGPFPAVVLISGSGPQDRNGEILDHRPFAVIADHLTRQGIAVLRYDERGVGESEGDFAEATSVDFAGDVQAAVQALWGDKRIDPERIGLIGHSEGGMIAPMVAVKMKRIAGLVLLASPGVTGRQISLRQGYEIRKAMGKPDASNRLDRAVMEQVIVDRMEGADEELIQERALGVMRQQLINLPTLERLAYSDSTAYVKSLIQGTRGKWLLFFLKYDPTAILKKVQVPVLALNGDLDYQVFADENLPAIKKALAEGNNHQVTIRTLSGLNHLFQKATTGLPSEYGVIEETFNSHALDIISDWLHQLFGI